MKALNTTRYFFYMNLLYNIFLLCKLIYFNTFAQIIYKCIFYISVYLQIASFIELIASESEQLNHFIAYKEMGSHWYKYDDHDVECVRLQKLYPIHMALYRQQNATTKYTKPKQGTDISFYIS